MITRELIAGRFTVVRLCGAGGMGLVYAVEDARFPGGLRALKVLRDEFVGNEKALKRFAEEVKAAARVTSAHVVKVYEYDDACERPWMVMELLEGETLEDRVSRTGRLPWETARALVVELGHGLGAAHAVGLLHLDLKPANIFLAKQQDAYGREQVKVMDFGISRQLLEGRTSAQASQSLGTLIWMPPEQGNRRAELRPSADVWPLGLIAFWMLTAKHYWLAVADDGEPEDIPNFYGELSQGAAVPASERAMERGSDRALPDGFDAWFAQCMAKDPGARWKNGSEATNALEEILAQATRTSGSVSTPAPSRHERGSVPTDQETSTPSEVPPISASRAPTADLGDIPIPPKGFTQWAEPPLAATLLGRTVVADPLDLPQPPPTLRPDRRLAWVALPALVLVSGGFWALATSGRSPNSSTSVPAVIPVSDARPPTILSPPVPHCPDGMVLVPEGTYQMGSPTGVGANNERPQHMVNVDAFCLDRTEVTVRAYARHARAPTTVNWPGYSAVDTRLWSQFCNGNRADRQDHPVNCVDWNEAAAYCRSVGGRLPTEAEWEYAARGTDGRNYPWGNESPNATRLNACGSECEAFMTRHSQGATAMYADSDRWVDTAPVGSFPGGDTPLGLHDMAGNVWEWTADWYGAYQLAGRPPSTGTFRVSRGGGWSDAGASWVRTAFRGKSGPGDRDNVLGFRCAQDVLR